MLPSSYLVYCFASWGVDSETDASQQGSMRVCVCKEALICIKGSAPPVRSYV